jgi:putative transposase
MSYTLSHKICLDPTYKQEEYFRRACGVARFTWNWALAKWKEEYKAGNKPTGLGLKKAFNTLKKQNFPWMYEVTKYASQQPFIYLQVAFTRFFKKLGRYPKFKRKGINDSFYIGNDHIKVEGKRIRLPKLGWVRRERPVFVKTKQKLALILGYRH